MMLDIQAYKLLIEPGYKAHQIFLQYNISSLFLRTKFLNRLERLCAYLFAVGVDPDGCLVPLLTEDAALV